LSILLAEPTTSFGASRTDEGVHALSNYYHFDTDKALLHNFIYKFNAILPPGVALKKLYRATDAELNARFNAQRRRYRYRIYFKKDPFLLNRALFYPYKMNRKVLDETAAIVEQNTHFESFSKRNTQSKTFRCHIYESRWEQHENELHYVVTANRFLRGMVRGLVCTQLQVARREGTAAEFSAIIDAKDCTKADFSVPGFGLYLEHIAYPENSLEEIVDRTR
jgi:tRNA pseudouridine38-40 synthase